VKVDALRRWTGTLSTHDLDQNGQVHETAQGPNGMPNGAESQTARNPKRRQMPKSAKSQTAPNGGAVPIFVALRDLALSGISRRLGFRAVRHLAPLPLCRGRRLGHHYRRRPPEGSPFHRKRPV